MTGPLIWQPWLMTFLNMSPSSPDIWRTRLLAYLNLTPFHFGSLVTSLRRAPSFGDHRWSLVLSPPPPLAIPPIGPFRGARPASRIPPWLVAARCAWPGPASAVRFPRHAARGQRFCAKMSLYIPGCKSLGFAQVVEAQGLAFWRGRCDPRANERRIEMARTFDSCFHSPRRHLDSKPACVLKCELGCILSGRARRFEEPRPRRRRSPREALPALATRPNDQGPAPSGAPCALHFSCFLHGSESEGKGPAGHANHWMATVHIAPWLKFADAHAFFDVEHLAARSACHLAGTRSYNGACDRCFIPGVCR